MLSRFLYRFSCLLPRANHHGLQKKRKHVLLIRAYKCSIDSWLNLVNHFQIALCEEHQQFQQLLFSSLTPPPPKKRKKEMKQEKIKSMSKWKTIMAKHVRLHDLPEDSWLVYHLTECGHFENVLSTFLGLMCDCTSTWTQILRVPYFDCD